MKHAKERKGLGFLLSLLLIVAALVGLLYAVGNLQTQSSAEGQRQLERSLMRATVSCYALEGQYPPDINYLQKHYGIVIDRSRFAVFYEIFGDNMMPNITVVPQ